MTKKWEFCNLDKEYRELSKEIPTWCHLKTTNEIIPVKWLISKSYDFLIERQITGTEMNFIINLINIWREENDSK